MSNVIDRYDSIEVINAKLKTPEYAGRTDEEIKGVLRDAGVQMISAFTVTDGQIVKVQK
jgi:hypothetical protein